MRRLFRTGFGRLTAPTLTQATAAGAFVRRRASAVKDIAADRARWGAPVDYLFAKITAATAIAGASNRWEYSWQEVAIDGSLALVDGELDHTLSSKALNLCEMLNNGTGSEGPGWDLSTAPTGFTIQPISDCVVQLWPMRRTDGELCWVFFAANVLDGECAANFGGG